MALRLRVVVDGGRLTRRGVLSLGMTFVVVMVIDGVVDSLETVAIASTGYM